MMLVTKFFLYLHDQMDNVGTFVMKRSHFMPI